jgi:putative flippase GtrA
MSADHKQLRQFTGFLIVGSFGFVVDLGVFAFSLMAHGSAPWARITASFVAIVATWIGNRSISFAKTANPAAEFVRYFAASLIGAAVNFAVFAVTLYLTRCIHFAYIAGTASGLVANYSGYSQFVFNKQKD